MQIVERSTPQVRRERSGTYRLKLALRHPATVIGIVLLVIFGYLIVAPVVSLLLSAFQVAFGDDGKVGLPAGSWTAAYLERVFASPVASIVFYGPLLNTLVVACVSIVLALVIGVPVAWLLARTDLPGRRWFSTALIVRMPVG